MAMKTTERGLGAMFMFVSGSGWADSGELANARCVVAAERRAPDVAFERMEKLEIDAIEGRIGRELIGCDRGVEGTLGEHVLLEVDRTVNRLNDKEACMQLRKMIKAIL